MRLLRQSTAAVVECGPFVSPVDAVTPVAALAIQPGQLSKNGVQAPWTPASWSYHANGHAGVGVAAGDVDTPGLVRLSWSAPGSYAPAWEDFAVLAAPVYDALFGATTAAAPFLDVAASSHAVAGSIGAAIGVNLKFAGLARTGVVKLGTSPTSTTFTVTLDVDLSPSTVVSDIVGQWVTILADGRQTASRQITNCAINSAAEIALQTAAFAGSPTPGDALMIQS